jgi:ATP-dependent DNA helicase RecQ
MQCRSIQLLAYFGETKSKRCGICDVCLEKNKVELNDLEFNNIKELVKSSLTDTPQHIYELVSNINANEEKVISVLRWLLENQHVIRQKDERFIWYDQLNMKFE